MIQYDLSHTPLARQTGLVAVPTEGEFFALAAALLILEHLAYADLRDRTLVLTRENLGQLAQIIQERLPSLSRDFRTDQLEGGLLARLSQLVGIKIGRFA